jgi:phosphoglycolate phosphatase
MKRLPSCIVFDIDGTLVDSLPGIEFSVCEAFKACGLPLPQQNMRQLIGPPIRNILSQAGNILEEAQLDTLEKAFRNSYDGEGWRMTVSYPDVLAVLRSMREGGHRLFIVSNKPRHVALQVLNKEGIIDYFERIITRDSRSPLYQTKTEMLRTLLVDHLCADKCVMVGDTLEDATAAANSGIQFILLTHGYGRVSEIPSDQVAFTLQSFSQFYELMTKEPVLD